MKPQMSQDRHGRAIKQVCEIDFAFRATATTALILIRLTGLRTPLRLRLPLKARVGDRGMRIRSALWTAS
jgi:hypothetical protein